MITESELAERVRSGGTIIKAVAYPWGVEFEEYDTSKTCKTE